MYNTTSNNELESTTCANLLDLNFEEIPLIIYPIIHPIIVGIIGDKTIIKIDDIQKFKSTFLYIPYTITEGIKNKELYKNWKVINLIILIVKIIFLVIGNENNSSLSLASNNIPWDLYAPSNIVRTAVKIIKMLNKTSINPIGFNISANPYA